MYLSTLHFEGFPFLKMSFSNLFILQNYSLFNTKHRFDKTFLNLT